MIFPRLVSAICEVNKFTERVQLTKELVEVVELISNYIWVSYILN